MLDQYFFLSWFVATMAGEPEAPITNVGQVVAAWKACNRLVLFAAGGIMCKIGKTSDLNRKEICANVEILQPVVAYLGPLTQEQTFFTV